jgi:hypothetical protein
VLREQGVTLNGGRDIPESSLRDRIARGGSFSDFARHAQCRTPIALVPLDIEHRAHAPAAIPDIEPDLPVVLDYAARG